MIKILTTKTWQSLLSRVDNLEQEVKALRRRSDDTAQQQNEQRNDFCRLRARIKCAESDIKDLTKKIEKTKIK